MSALAIDGLVDGAARRTIRNELDRTLVVEAAAGTGKTTELVERIVAVVQRGAGKLSSLVAVTFTEKAAGEMKLRVRTELDRALGMGVADPQARARLGTALLELETAKIGTIHALCADLLRAHPVAADVDPAFEVADGERSRLLLKRAFDAAFMRWAADPPEGVRRVLARAAIEGVREDPRSALSFAVGRLVETRDFDTPFRRDPLDREQLLRGTMVQLTKLCALGQRSRDGRDPLRRALLLLDRRVRAVRSGNADVIEAFMRSIVRDWDIWERNGRGKLFGDGLLRSDIIAQLASVRAELRRSVAALDADLAACLSRELLPVVAGYEQQKAEYGVLDFFDLLLRTRNLLRDHVDVREELQARVTHLFVDEFQDTDPVQAEILLLLAADSSGESDPYRVQPAPGKLFVVGDPKQSIYRFRRADVTLYERVKAHLFSRGAEVVQLSTSFRSLPAIQSLVNGAFEPLMAGDAERGQASYVKLSPHRAARSDQPAVVALPVPSPYGGMGRVTKKAINESLPDAVAAWLDWLLHHSGYRVPEDGRDVPLEARHVCLLFRRFRAWEGDVTRDYVRALEARRIPHVLSGGRAFYAREEVMALCAALKAIEWPDDELHVYATLRGPFVAFNDDALLAFKNKHGHLSPFRKLELATLTGSECEIASVLQAIARLHRTRNRTPIATTLASFMSELRVHAGVAIWPTGEQSLGNLYKLLSLARSYERRRGASSFRGFVRWLEQNAQETGAADATVVEESSDGVRIMTVHAAKGLEFPVVVLCDPTAPKKPEYASRYIDVERKLWAQPLCDAEPTELTEQRERVREHDEAELTRLSYVAATRAREMLVVPVCGDGPIEGWTDVLAKALFPSKAQFRNPLRVTAPFLPPFGQDSVVSWPASLLRVPGDSIVPGEHQPEAGEHRVVFWDPNLLDLSRRTQGGLLQEELLKVDEQGTSDALGSARYAEFLAARSAQREQGARPSVRLRTVTDLPDEPLLTEEPGLIMLDSGAQRAGRPSGKRFGSLVHALLQHASLMANHEQLSALARFLGRTLGASEAERTRAVVDVLHALAHPLFERARAAERAGMLYRETPITTRTEDGTLLDGAVDLAFRELGPDGARMILVDYKTDLTIADLGPYARQLKSYAEALTRALGQPVESVLFRV